MAVSKYRIGRISISGFKAFSTKQSIDLAGKHLFIFGENGRGKSSIVEAVRWALFGLAERSETEVRNQFYGQGECQVDLELLASDGIWNLTRRLRAGGSRSDQEILDPNKKVVPQSMVFPHIARLGPKEGTHIIFAAQQASQRRPQADISDFDRVLYSYLRLEDIPDLLSRLDELIEEQLEAERQVGEKISAVEERLRSELQEVNLRLEEILRNKPWPDEINPTIEHTERKIDEFVAEIARMVQVEIPKDANRGVALEVCERALSTFTANEKQQLETRLAEITSDLEKLSKLSQERAAIESDLIEYDERIVSTERKFSSAAAGKAQSELEEELGLLKLEQKQKVTKHEIVERALSYCSEFPTKQCPVCLTEMQPEKLAENINESLNEGEPSQKELVQRIDKTSAWGAPLL